VGGARPGPAQMGAGRAHVACSLLHESAGCLLRGPLQHCSGPQQHAVVRYNIALVRNNMRRGANRSLFLRGFSGASVSSTGWSCTSPPPFHTGSTQGYSKGPPSG
jgi:hypothetical protein